MSVKRKDREPEQTIRYQNRIIALLFAVVAGLVVAYWRLPKNLWVYQPPDVSKAFVQKVGDIPLASIYGFSRTLWEALNYCESDCHKEYPERIARYRTYLTDSCYLELENHYQKNQSLYGYRSRTLLPTENAIFASSRIRQMSADSWFVRQEYLLRDHVNGVTVRESLMEYPLKIVRSSRPIDVNPLGLEVDCYFDRGPVVLEEHDIKKGGNI